MVALIKLKLFGGSDENYYIERKKNRMQE